MIDILVSRGDGGNDGGLIQDPLITSTVAALERGRVAIDEASINRTETLQILYRPGIRPGLVVRVMDSLQGVVWNGVIQSCTLAIEGTSRKYQLTVKRSV